MTTYILTTLLILSLLGWVIDHRRFSMRLAEWRVDRSFYQAEIRQLRKARLKRIRLAFHESGHDYVYEYELGRHWDLCTVVGRDIADDECALTFVGGVSVTTAARWIENNARILEVSDG